MIKHIRWWRPIFAAMVGLLMLVALSSPLMAHQQSKGFGERVHTVNSDKALQVQPFVQVALDNDAIVSFYEFSDANGASSIGIMETLPPHVASVLEHEQLKNATPFEIFQAIAEAGTAIPEQFKHKATEASTQHAQGWFRHTHSKISAPAACSGATFQNQINGFGYPKKLIRLDERPQDHPGRWPSSRYVTGGVIFYNAHNYKAQVNSVDRFYTKVIACSLANHPDSSARKFVITGRSPGGTVHEVVNKSVQTVGTSAAWHFYTGTDWKWTTEVKRAMPSDRYNIGLTWRNS